MQNANPENVPNNVTNDQASGNIQSPVDNGLMGAAQNQMGNVQQAAKTELNNLGQQAQSQINNVGQQAQAQMNNLAQGVQNQLQNVGQAGVSQLGSIVNQFTAPLTSKAVQPPVKNDEKIYGGLAYIPFVAFACVILKPDSAFVRLHSKQGILLTMLFLFVGILAAIVSIFGVIGAFLSFLLGLVPLAAVIIGIYSMYLAFTGYWWKIPGLSAVADLIPIEAIAKASKENITGQVSMAKEDYDNRQDTLATEKKENTVPAQNVPNNTNSTVGNPPQK